MFVEVSPSRQRQVTVQADELTLRVLHGDVSFQILLG